MNSQDAAVLILRAKYLNQLRPKPKGIIANRMVENLPHFRNQGESKRKTAKKHQIPSRKDESHKTKPSYRAAHGPAPDIALGIAIEPNGVMQLGGQIAQGMPIAAGVPLGVPVGVHVG